MNNIVTKTEHHQYGRLLAQGWKVVRVFDWIGSTWVELAPPSLTRGYR